MFRSIWMLSIHAHDFFQHYMPSNRLLAATRTRRGLKWGVPAMLVGVPYLAIANVCTILIDRGAPEWLHLVVLWASGTPSSSFSTVPSAYSASRERSGASR